MDPRIALGLVLMLVSPAWSQSASAQDFEGRLSAATRAYEDLEYEQALEQLADANVMARDDGDRARVAIYRGLVLADLGRRQEALSAFRAGLTLRPDASLPAKVSPKVSSDFEEMRRQVQREQARGSRPPADAPRSMPDARLARTPPPGAQGEVRSTRSTPVLPLALLGTGAVLGGVGGYFGLKSRSNVSAARDAAFHSDRKAHLDSARGQALAANVLLGAAVTAAASAAITWFLSEKDASPRAEVSP
ncbi:tetratricopeptide repeat protein [Pyxidicoccus fallax]|uniref:Tetratricopeptide repeat protein n=1 Tax=Pyxidicoccus fallax TaxID=394095 RepID=A0A848L7Z5_9BACT|nr:tetratricopeptide repeat protein [Pyxidicoccus fallax]NMO15110.1 tetratricopeptide repeat protein [Pyxidicoccus fallax]NPC81801.1 tetratricopeptide repeat protein [Pyxidicoccus fallax]